MRHRTSGGQQTGVGIVGFALMAAVLIMVGLATFAVMHGLARTHDVKVGPSASSDTVAFIDAEMPKLAAIVAEWNGGSPAKAIGLWKRLDKTVPVTTATDNRLADAFLEYANNVRYYMVGDGSATLKDVEISREEAKATMEDLRP